MVDLGGYLLAFSNRTKAKRLKLTKPVIIIGVEIYWTVGSIPRTSTILKIFQTQVQLGKHRAETKRAYDNYRGDYILFQHGMVEK